MNAIARKVDQEGFPRVVERTIDVIRRRELSGLRFLRDRSRKSGLQDLFE